ncbi:unnamed protein product [Discosporangium mesarthrocarpum]
MRRRHTPSKKGPSLVRGALKLVISMQGIIALFGGRGMTAWKTTARASSNHAAYILPNLVRLGFRRYTSATSKVALITTITQKTDLKSSSSRRWMGAALNGGRYTASMMSTGGTPSTEKTDGEVDWMPWASSERSGGDEDDVPSGRGEGETSAAAMRVAEGEGWELEPDPKAEAIFYGDKLPFQEIGISPALCAHLKSVGLTHSTAIQAAAIPGILGGEDMVVGAETGSGKTLAYLLPIVQRLLSGEALAEELPEELLGKARGWAMFPDVVVLVPNKELAEQVLGVLQEILRGLSILGKRQGITAAALYGSSYEYPYSPRNPSPTVLVCTPVFLHKYTNMRAIPLFCKATALVMDEADMLMDGSYKRQLDDILLSFRRADKLSDAGQGIPKTQYVMAAATLPSYGLKSVDQYIKRTFPMARKIKQIHMHQHHPAIQQEFVEIGPGIDEKVGAVIKLLRARGDSMAKTMIFTNTAASCQALYEALDVEGFSVVAYHKNTAPMERLDNLAALRTGNAKILVCTDLAARGIDVPSVTHIVQMEMATNVVQHLHRLGRAARAGRKGTAVTFYDSSVKDLVNSIEGVAEGSRLDGSFSRKRGFRNKLKKYGPGRRGMPSTSNSRGRESGERGEDRGGRGPIDDSILLREL